MWPKFPNSLGLFLKRSLWLLLFYCIFPNKWMCHCAAVCEICDPWSWRFGHHRSSWGWDDCVCHTISVCTKGTVTWNQGVCMCACVCEKGDNALDEPWNYSHGWGLLTSLFNVSLTHKMCSSWILSLLHF